MHHMNSVLALGLLVLLSMVLVRLMTVGDHAKSYACISARSADRTCRNGSV